MKTYTVIFAEDVPFYASEVLHAGNDADAIELAKMFDRSKLYFDPEWSSIVCRRIVEIYDNDGSRTVAMDIPCDEYFLRNGGDAERRLCDAAPELLAVLDEAGKFDWVHNAAITQDIEALRRICLQYAKWWNERALPTIAKAKGGAS